MTNLSLGASGFWGIGKDVYLHDWSLRSKGVGLFFVLFEKRIISSPLYSLKPKTKTSSYNKSNVRVPICYSICGETWFSREAPRYI